MNCTVKQESFDSLDSCWKNPANTFCWSSVFILPAWLKLWWQEFKPADKPYLASVRQGEKCIGVAPLRINGSTASFIGSPDVCDYLDFIVEPGSEKPFFSALLHDLKQIGVDRLDLHCLRPDSIAITSLLPIAQENGYEVSCAQEDVSVEMEVPPSWDAFLEALDSKQRHELKRKLRKIGEAGKAEFRILSDAASISSAMETFFKMFTESRSDKATFLTEQKESFFKSLAKMIGETGFLRLGILELDSFPTAMILFFDYKDGFYLYNCGYDPSYTSLSVGAVSKALCIEESINRGKKVFDFLKGNETYKYYMGGKDTILSNLIINIS